MDLRQPFHALAVAVDGRRRVLKRLRMDQGVKRVDRCLVDTLSIGYRFGRNKFFLAQFALSV